MKEKEKTTDTSHVTDKLYHIMVYASPWSRFKLTTSVVIGTDCIGSCKSNYHTITVTTAPYKCGLHNINLVLSISFLCLGVLGLIYKWFVLCYWRGVLDTTLCEKVCQWIAAGQLFSPGTRVSSTNKTDCHDITEILLKVTLNTIKQTNTHL
jgi:hypothetical protein